MTQPQPLPFFHPVSLIATWFGSGLLPRAPGTWGSLAALPFGALLAWAGGPWALAAAAAVLFLIGIWASDRYAKAMQLDDPGAVVVDEVAAQWVTLIPCGLNPWLFLAAFVAFRLSDVLKPWPVGWADRRLKGGLGIMIDDMIAAVYAGLACLVLARFVG